MNDEYHFNEQELANIIVNVLAESIACHEAMFRAFAEQIGKSEEEIDQIITRSIELLPDIKERVIQKLYEKYGKTPPID